RDVRLMLCIPLRYETPARKTEPQGVRTSVRPERNMTDRVIRLEVVAEHWLVRLGLTSLFTNLRHFAVVAEAETAAGAIAAAREHRADVVIMGVRLPDGSGVDACRQIRSERPTTRVVMLTSFADEDAVVAAIL